MTMCSLVFSIFKHADSVIVAQ